MSKLLLVVVVSLLISQVKSTSINPHDLAGEAQKELDELKSIVEGTINIAHSHLGDLETDFLINSNNVLNTANINIQQESETVQEQLDAIKDLANSAGVDITSCTYIREPLLKQLPSEYYNLTRRCILDQNTEGTNVVFDGIYYVDVYISQVHNLQFQLTQCEGNLLCIQPVLREIQLDKIRIPQNINGEVSSVDMTLRVVKLSVQACSDDNVAKYIRDANALLQDMSSCVDRILG